MAALATVGASIAPVHIPTKSVEVSAFVRSVVTSMLTWDSFYVALCTCVQLSLSSSAQLSSLALHNYRSVQLARALQALSLPLSFHTHAQCVPPCPPCFACV